MKKNGFIATSILYSFFLLFISLFVATIGNYLHNQALISKINENAVNGIVKHSNLNIANNFLPGDFFRFKPNSDEVNGLKLKDDNLWMLYLNRNTVDEKILTFISVDNIFNNDQYKISDFLSDCSDEKCIEIFRTNNLMRAEDPEHAPLFNLRMPKTDDLNNFKKITGDDDTIYYGMYDIFGSADYFNESILGPTGLSLDKIKQNIANEFKKDEKVLVENGGCFSEYGVVKEADCLADGDKVFIYSGVGSSKTSFCMKKPTDSVANNDKCALNLDGIRTYYEDVGENRTVIEDSRSAYVGRLILEISIDLLNGNNSSYPIKYGNGSRDNPYYLD